MPENTAFMQELTPHERDVLETKALRVYLDTAVVRVKNLNKSRSTALTLTKLDEAIMWLGQNLRELDTPNPYPNSREQNTTIDPLSR